MADPKAARAALQEKYSVKTAGRVTGSAKGIKTALKAIQQKYAPQTADSKQSTSRDAFDSGVRKSYAQRAAQENRKTTSGGFYSQPNFGKDAERLQTRTKTAQRKLENKQKELESAAADVAEMERGLRFVENHVNQLYNSYLSSSTQQAASLYQKANGIYETRQKEYNESVNSLNGLYAEYESLLGEYNQAAERYNTYTAGQKAEYDAWRGTIRGAEDIQADIAAQDSQIAALRQQQKDLDNEALQIISRVSKSRSMNPQAVEWGRQAANLRRQAADLDTQIAQLEEIKTLLDEELSWAQYFPYADLMDAEDFTAKSGYVSTANGKTRSNLDILLGNNDSSLTGYDDPLYEYINGNQEMGAYLANQASQLYGGDSNPLGALFGRTTENRAESQQMTGEEVAIFNYLYATQGKDAAHQYYDYLTGDLNYRQRQADQAYWANQAKESPVASSVFSVATKPLGLLSYAGQAADFLATGTIDQNAAYNKYSYIPNAIRDEVSANIEKNEKWGKAGSFGYDIGMGLADFLYAGALTGGFAGGGGLSSGMTTAILGSGAAADTVISAKDRGLSDNEAFALGTIAGVAESAMEKISLDTLLKGAWNRNAVGYILKNALAEGGEEVGTDVINTLADIVIAKDQSQWQAAVDAYIADGKSENEAFGLALADQAAALGLSFLGGAISGGVMGSVYAPAVRQQSNAYQKAGAAVRKMGDERIRQLVDTGLAADPKSAAYATAKEVQEKLNQNQDIDDYALGKLLSETAALPAQQGIVEESEGIMLPTAEEAMAQRETEEPEGIMLPTVEEILAEWKAEQPTRDTVQQAPTQMQDPGMLPTVEEILVEWKAEQLAQGAAEQVPARIQDPGMLPTAEEVMARRETEQSAQDAIQQTPTQIQDPGMLPTAEEAERNAQKRRAMAAASTELERSAIEYDVETETFQRVQRISQAIGRDVVFYDSPDAGENGRYDNQTGVIYVNARSANPAAQIIGHELTHSLEDTEAYAGLRRLVLRQLEESGANLDSLRQKKSDLYAAHGKPLATENEIDYEIVAEYVEKHLLTDEQSIRNLVHENKTLGERILDWLDRLLAKLGVNSAKERVFLKRARDTYARALGQAASKAQNDTKAMLRTLRRDYADGKLTEEAFDDAMEAIVETEGVNGLAMLKKNDFDSADDDDANPETLGQSDEIWGETYERPGGRPTRNQANVETAQEEVERWEQEFADRWGEGSTNLTLARRYVELMEALNEPGNHDAIIQEIENIDQTVMENGWDDLLTGYAGARVRLSMEKAAAMRSRFDKIKSPGGVVSSTETGEDAHTSGGFEGGIAENGLPAKEQFSIGKTADGMEVYETSEEIRRMPYKQRKKVFMDIMCSQYRGRTAKFVVDGDVYYAKFDKDDLRKNIYGDKRSSPRGWEAKINTGADGHIFELVEGAQHRGGRTETGKTTAAHKGVTGWEYFVKTVQIDGQVYDLLANVRKKPEGEYVYSIQLRENKKKTPAPPAAPAYTNTNVSDGYASKWVPTGVSSASVAENGSSVKGQFSISEDGGDDKRKIIGDLRAILNSENAAAQLSRYVDTLEGEEYSGEEYGTEKRIDLLTYEEAEAAKLANTAPDEGLRQNQENEEQDGNLDETASQAPESETQQSQEKNHEEADDPPVFSISALPVKAQRYLNRTERHLMNKIGVVLSIPSGAPRRFLLGIVRDVSAEYMMTGTVSQQTLDDLFEQAYEEGIEVDSEYYDTYKELKNHLRTQAITIAEQDKADIADWNDFRRSTLGTLRIVNKGGLPVDAAYMELQDMAPELFPEDITHPADQLKRMFEVGRNIQRTEKKLDEVYSYDAEEFKRWAKREFCSAINEMLGELRLVKRFADEKAQKAEPAPESTLTQEQVTAMYGQLKEARKTYEKAAARNLLTQHDEKQVGKLLRGEIELEDLKPAKDNVKGITAVYEARQEYERLTKHIREWNQSRKAQMKKTADSLLETANGWKDKKAGVLYSRETMERNIRDIVEDSKLAEEIIAEYFKPVHDAQAEATRMKNRYRERVLALKLSREAAEGNVVSEAHAVQLLGEAQDCIRMLEQSRNRMRRRDGKTLSDWQDIVDNLWIENPKLDKEKIEAAVKEFRSIYDELFQQMNESRVRNGYEPVNYRNGYFPHFQPGDGDGILGQFGRALGIDMDVSTLPTTINGLTHTFRPGIQWFGSAQERLGFKTAYDAVEGFDRYIEGVADVVHQTDNIQKLRTLAAQIRYRTSEEGIQKQVDAVKADTTLSEDEEQYRIEKIYETGKCALSNFVVELEEYTNLLANKKSRHDRNLESDLDRSIYTIMKNLESRVGANMVAVNVGSWLTNLIPLTQGAATLDRGMLLRGMWDTLKAYKNDDGIVGRSTFLTNRRGSDPIVKVYEQGTGPNSKGKFSLRAASIAAGKAGDVLSKPMEYIDSFTADSLVRARYRQNIKKGLSEDAAMSEADNWVAGVMADRSKGSMPTLFNRSNPLTKVFTQFQLEVNNQLSYLFKDIPRDVREKGLKALAAALLKFFLGAYLFNEVYEYFIGRRPALDPLGILNDTVGDLTGYELPNLVELGVGAVTGDLPSFQTEKAGLAEAGKNLAGSVAGELPFFGGVLADGGRVPISSALPDVGNLWDAATEDDWSAGKRWQEVRDELLEKPVTYLLPSFGGGQMKKILEGLEAVIRGGSYTVDKDGSDILQYPVYKDSAGQAVLNTAGAMVFGKTTLPTGRDWVESGFKSLNAKETACYQAMTDADIAGEEAFGLLQELCGAEKTDTESESTVKRETLRKSDIPGEGKGIVYYGLMASDKERELMNALADGADMGEVTGVLMDMKDADSLTGAASSNAKREAIMDAVLNDEEKILVYRYMMGSKQEDGSYTSSRDDDIVAFEQAGMDFDQFLQAQNEYSAIDEAYGSAGEKALKFSRWVNSQMLTVEQADTMRDCFKYYSQIPQEAAGYNDFMAAGLDDDAAYELASALNGLEPVEGEDSVSSKQKWRVVVDSGMTPSDQLAALEAVSNEGQYRKFTVAYDMGVMPDVYVAAYETLPMYDADGNGSYKNAEIEAALDSFGTAFGGIMLPAAGQTTVTTLTNSEKAVLWQLITGSASARNNPYSTSIGQEVIDAVKVAKEGAAASIALPSGGIVLPTAGSVD